MSAIGLSRRLSLLVVAASGCGESSAPNDRNELGVPDVEAPTWPDGAHIRVRSVGRYHATLEWDAALDDRDVAGYQLVTASSRLSSDGATTTLTGLSPGTEVAVSIVAFDRAGHRTETALTASFETLGGCVEVGASVPRTVQARAP